MIRSSLLLAILLTTTQCQLGLPMTVEVRAPNDITFAIDEDVEDACIHFATIFRRPPGDEGLRDSDVVWDVQTRRDLKSGRCERMILFPQASAQFEVLKSTPELAPGEYIVHLDAFAQSGSARFKIE